MLNWDYQVRAAARAHLPGVVEQQEGHWRKNSTNQAAKRLGGEHGTRSSEADVPGPADLQKTAWAAGGWWNPAKHRHAVQVPAM